MNFGWSFPPVTHLLATVLKVLLSPLLIQTVSHIHVIVPRFNNTYHTVNFVSEWDIKAYTVLYSSIHDI